MNIIGTVVSTFATADVPNKNGEIYPLAVLQGLVEKQTGNRTMGMLGEVEGPGVAIDKVSHQVHNLRLDGDKLIGEVTVIGTPQGLVLAELLKAHVPINYAMTGFVEYEPDTKVVSNLFLRSIDAVAEVA